MLEALDEMKLDEMKLSVPVVRVGWPDEFIEHGKVDQLRRKYGLTAEATVERVLALIPARRTAQEPDAEPRPRTTMRRMAG